MGTESLGEGRIEDVGKAEEMAYAENPYRTIAKNARKEGMEELAKSFEEKAEKKGEEAGEKYEAKLKEPEKEATKFIEEFLTKRMSGDTPLFALPKARERFFPRGGYEKYIGGVKDQKAADLVCKLIGAETNISSFLEEIDKKGFAKKEIKTALPDTTLTVGRVNRRIAMSIENNLAFYLHQK